MPVGEWAAVDYRSDGDDITSNGGQTSISGLTAVTPNGRRVDFISDFGGQGQSPMGKVGKTGVVNTMFSINEV